METERGAICHLEKLIQIIIYGIGAQPRLPNDEHPIVVCIKQYFCE